jgi:hypothetical protein
MSFFLAVVAADEFEGLYEHTPGAAAGVVDLSFVGLDHFGDEVDHTLGGVELAPELALVGGEFAKEIFVYAPDDILGLVGHSVDVVDGVEKGGEFADIEIEAGEIVVGQGTLEGGVVLFHEGEGGVNPDGEISLLGILEQVGPAGLLGQVENIFHGIELHHIHEVLLTLVYKFRPAGDELIGYKLEKDQAKHDMLVLGRLDGTAQLIGGIPERLLKALGILGSRSRSGRTHIKTKDRELR